MDLQVNASLHNHNLHTDLCRVAKWIHKSAQIHSSCKEPENLCIYRWLVLTCIGYPNSETFAYQSQCKFMQFGCASFFNFGNMIKHSCKCLIHYVYASVSKVLFLHFLCESVITGPHKSGVLSASNRIEVIAESSRQKVPPTHFLSFPLYNDKLVERFQVFKQRVLQECGQVGNVTVFFMGIFLFILSHSLLRKFKKKLKIMSQ